MTHEAARDAKHAGRRFEAVYDEKGFHGYIERERVPTRVPPRRKLPTDVPSARECDAPGEKDKMCGARVDFINDVLQRHGWSWPRNR